MNKTLFISLCLSFVIISHNIHAATLIESKESKAGQQNTWIDGDRLRVESEGGEQYMIMNFTEKTMYIVHPGKMQAMDMSKVIGSHSGEIKNESNHAYTVENKGKGPTIAGYTTDHYVVSVKGEQCFESFTSLKAVQEMGLEHFISGMNEMFPRENSSDRDKNPCVDAENALEYQKIGIPLMLVEQNGQEIYSITKLEKNAPVPAGGFSIPEGFNVIDYGLMVQRMEQPAQN